MKVFISDGDITLFCPTCRCGKWECEVSEIVVTTCKDCGLILTFSDVTKLTFEVAYTPPTIKPE
jgi:hypothetical protein